MVAPTITFEALHEIIQGAMGWTGGHLHQFIVGDRRNGTYIGAEDGMGFEDILDQSGITIDQCLQKAKDKLWYEYDFGDGWEHEITLVKIMKVDQNQVMPLVVKGKGACPPEDCGGPWGYEALKETIKNPKAEDYEEMMDWLGDDFDPNDFDIEEANDRLVDGIILPSIHDMIEEREPNDVLINFSQRNTRLWSEEQLKAAKKEFGEVINLEFPSLRPNMTQEEIQMLAAISVEEIFQLNPKAVHIVEGGSFLVMVVHLLMNLGIPSVESTFEKNIAMSKTGEKEVSYKFIQFRAYF